MTVSAKTMKNHPTSKRWSHMGSQCGSHLHFCCPQLVTSLYYDNDASSLRQPPFHVFALDENVLWDMTDP